MFFQTIHLHIPLIAASPPTTTTPTPPRERDYSLVFVYGIKFLSDFITLHTAPLGSLVVVVAAAAVIVNANAAS